MFAFPTAGQIVNLVGDLAVSHNGDTVSTSILFAGVQSQRVQTTFGPSASQSAHTYHSNAHVSTSKPCTVVMRVKPPGPRATAFVGDLTVDRLVHELRQLRRTKKIPFSAAEIGLPLIRSWHQRLLLSSLTQRSSRLF
jgi:hypothetical protein